MGATPPTAVGPPPTADSPLAVANLALRFGLELGGLAAFAYWAWATRTGALRLVLVVAVPLAVAALWAGFRVPDDGGDPVVTAVRGTDRLALEAVVFGAAALALWDAGQSTLAVGFAVAVLVHNLLAWRRLRWLLHVGAPDGDE
jgi:hypothetical protein